MVPLVCRAPQGISKLFWLLQLWLSIVSSSGAGRWSAHWNVEAVPPCAAQEGKDREGIMQNPVEAAGRIWIGRMQLNLEMERLIMRT